MLEIKNLSVNYIKDDIVIEAVKKASFSVDVGETLGVIGESGSGKSTIALSILRLLPGNARISSGEIMFNGADILHLDESKLTGIRGGEIGMIFQDPFSSLNPVFTVGDQIGEAVMLHRKVKGKGLEVKELLRMVHLDEDVAKKYPHELSGGMQQRVMIAIALAGNPKLLIADEPTSALDVTIQAGILALLKELQEKLGMGIIFITHNLALTYRFCDRLIIMRSGEVVEAGITDQIFTSPGTDYAAKLIGAIPKPKWRKLPPL